MIEQEEAMQFWLNLNENSKQFPADLFLPSLPIQMRAMVDAKVAPGFSLNESATFECASSSAGHTHINIDSAFNMLGSDIAKDYTHIGNVMKELLEKVWNSYASHLLRTAKFPACYKIHNEKGNLNLII